MSGWRLHAPVCLALTLVACALNRPAAQPITYVIDTPLPSAQAPAAARREPQTLRMGRVHIAAAFSGTALIYRMSDVKFTSDPYSAFIADPAAMLGDQMATWLNYAGPFQSVAAPESTQSVSYVLEANVTELYGDFRPGRTPEAALAIQFSLIDLSGAHPHAMLQRSLAQRVKLAAATPEALVRGYGLALDDLLSELRGDLQLTLSSRQHAADRTP
jgi:uncharacterized lipoprotein YmbA